MESHFWISKWKRNDITFHQNSVDESLVHYFDRLSLSVGDTIFVPLCAKSCDLQWLLSKNMNVIGVELSELACRDFFKENNMAYDVSTVGRFTCFYNDKIKIYQGDYFDLSSDLLADVKAIYDRRALVALPQALRERYCEFMSVLLPQSIRMLLITIEYADNELQGPPFSIPEEEVTRLYKSSFLIEHLTSFDIKQRDDHLNQRALVKPGLSYLTEGVYLLRKSD